MRHRLSVKQSVDGQWVATCRSLPEVVCRGLTRQDAVHGIAEQIQKLSENDAGANRWVMDPNLPPARFWIWLHVSALAGLFALGAVLWLLGDQPLPQGLIFVVLPIIGLPMLLCPPMVLWSAINRRQTFVQSLLALAAETMLCVLQGILLFPAVQ